MPGATVEEETVIEQQEPSQETDQVQIPKEIELREENIKTDFSGAEGDSGATIQTVNVSETAKLADVQGIRVEDMMNENHAQALDSQLIGENSKITKKKSQKFFSDELQAAETLAQATAALENAESSTA